MKGSSSSLKQFNRGGLGGLAALVVGNQLKGSWAMFEVFLHFFSGFEVYKYFFLKIYNPKKHPKINCDGHGFMFLVWRFNHLS